MQQMLSAAASSLIRYIQCVRLSRPSVGVQTHSKSSQFHSFIHSILRNRQSATSGSELNSGKNSDLELESAVIDVYALGNSSKNWKAKRTLIILNLLKWWALGFNQLSLKHWQTTATNTSNTRLPITSKHIKYNTVLDSNLTCFYGIRNNQVDAALQLISITDKNFPRHKEWKLEINQLIIRYNLQ